MKDRILKIGLIALAVFSVCFASVKAENVEDLIEKYCSDGTSNCSYSFNKQFTTSFQNILSDLPSGKTICIKITESTYANAMVTFAFNNVANNQNPSTTFIAWANWGDGSYVCSRSANYLLGKSDNNSTIKGDVFILSDLLATALPVMTSLECQTEYNLIPITEVDSAYCQSNNLCPSGGTPSDCPNVGVSNLFINDIFHPGAFNIIMNIPEEIDWDYAYTNSGANFNLDVVGYNQDTEYINSLVDINSYQPTSEDFTSVFELFGQYGGLLLACLFVILVFYLIKKAFK